MDIRTHTESSVMVIGLDGDLDSSSARTLQEEILPSLPADQRILLDLTNVPFVSSAGLRAMLLVYRQAQCVNSTVALVGLAPEPRAVLSATGFLGFFVCADDVPGGVAMLAGRALGRGVPA